MEDLDSCDIRVDVPKDLTSTQLRRCLAIIAQGEAVNPAHVREKLPYVTMLATAVWKAEIVGVGAIKAPDPAHNLGVATSSGYELDAGLLETGYIAVDPAYRQRGLGHRLLAALLERHRAPVYGTTSSPQMEKVLLSLGYWRVGRAWAGDHRPGKQLSLWLWTGGPFSFEALSAPFCGWAQELLRWGRLGASTSAQHYIPLTDAGRAAARQPFAPSLECWQLLSDHAAFTGFMEAYFPSWIPKRVANGGILRHGCSVSGNGVSLPPPKVTASVRRRRRFMRLVKKRPSRALLAAAPALPFRVEAIRGRYEYVQHSAWIDGDPIVVVTGRQDMGDDLVIKRGSVTYERCDDVDFGAIFRALKYTGFACVDFKIKDGQPKIFEINPRLGGSLVLGPDLDPVMGAVAKKLGL